MITTKHRSLTISLLLGLSVGFFAGYYWPKTIHQDSAQPSQAVHARLQIGASFEPFPDGEPLLDGVSIVAQRDLDKNPHYRHSMRFLRNGAYLICSFEVPQVPDKAVLRVTHLSSLVRGLPNDGVSPVTITINNKEVVANHSPPSKGYIVEEWPVGTHLQAGMNTIRFGFDNSTSHYWLQSFSIMDE